MKNRICLVCVGLAAPRIFIRSLWWRNPTSITILQLPTSPPVLMDNAINPPSESPIEGSTIDASGQQLQPSEQQPSTARLFEALHTYPFSTDHDFAKGLAIILRHPDVPASEEEINRTDDLVLQAKCFYFSRKEKLTHNLDFTAYKSWAAGLESPQSAAAVPPSSEQEDRPTAPALPTEEPTYPSSFSHIVELITNGQPIPGIQQIPDTVLEGHDTPSTKPRRQKPWEKESKVEV